MKDLNLQAKIEIATYDTLFLINDQKLYQTQFFKNIRTVTATIIIRTKSVDNHFVRYKDVDSNSDKDVNNHQRVALTCPYPRTNLLILSPSITKKVYQFL